MIRHLGKQVGVNNIGSTGFRRFSETQSTTPCSRFLSLICRVQRKRFRAGLNSPSLTSVQFIDIDKLSQYHKLIHGRAVQFAAGYFDRGSLYISQSFISPDRNIVLHRRKIKPTHVERSVSGNAQSECLNVVVDSPWGRVGGLSCWENVQPLLKYHEYTQGVQIHVACWLLSFEMPSPDDTLWSWAATDQGCLLASRMVAVEGQAFVVVATQIITEANMKKCGLEGSKVVRAPGWGFSMIFGPDGSELVKATSCGEEGILHADVGLKAINFAETMNDGVGHYSRPT